MSDEVNDNGSNGSNKKSERMDKNKLFAIRSITGSDAFVINKKFPDDELHTEKQWKEELKKIRIYID